jgi:RNA polymerase sigma-70 factor (ECF subfamily)
MSLPLLRDEAESKADWNSPPVTSSNDELFLRAAVSRNPREGCDLIFKRYYNPLRSHAIRFVYDYAVAEDLVAEVFYEFWKNAQYARIDRSYRAYLFLAVRHRAYNHVVRSYRLHLPLPEPEAEPATSLLQPDQTLQMDELSHAIETAIASLSPQCRKVFLMSRVEEKKQTDIAAELGLSLKTIETHMSRALAHLRQNLRAFQG